MKDHRASYNKNKLQNFSQGSCVYRFQHNIGVFYVLEWYSLVINVEFLGACECKPNSFRISCIAPFKYPVCMKNMSNVFNMFYAGHKLH